jgi:hypothetical protein
VIRTILTTTLAGVLSFSAVGALAQTQQEVAFIGDSITRTWGTEPQFTAHTNWQNYATNIVIDEGVEEVEAQLQNVIVSGKKPIVHLLFGTGSYLDSPGNPQSAIFSTWATGFAQIVNMAQEAKLKIVVGTVPYPLLVDDAINKWIFVYCTAHNVPVVNYAFALNSGTGFAADAGITEPGTNPFNGQPFQVIPTYYSNTNFPFQALTSQGWDLMTDMAQTAIIQEEGYTVKGGYLNTVVFDGNSIQDFEDYPTANTNTVADGGIVQFTPYLQYTDGSTHIMNNADVNGHLGTWTTSNPEALFMTEHGVGLAMQPGTANVHFTTLAGKTINEWVMYTFLDNVP